MLTTLCLLRLRAQAFLVLLNKFSRKTITLDNSSVVEDVVTTEL
jgi:hypothetical protein